MTILLTITPNGAVPESTPAISIGEILSAELATFGPPAASPGCVKRWPAGRLVTGSWPLGVRLPMLARLCWPNTFHCTPRSRPACRVASTKRTSSMTCCGEVTLTDIDDVRAELLGDHHRLVDGRAVRRGAGEHDAAVDRRHPEPGIRKAARISVLHQRGVVHHLDVEHADQLLAFGIGRHARRAVLLAEDRQRAVGQRIDVGHLGIADRQFDEARVGADVLGLADVDRHRRGALGAADLDRPLRRCLAAGHRGKRRNRRRDDQRHASAPSPSFSLS